MSEDANPIYADVGQFPLDWLASLFGQAPGALRGYATKPVGTGQMCDSFRLTLDWAEGVAGLAGGESGGTLPATIIAKCPSHDPASRDVAQRLGGYLLEVNWYRTLARDVAVATPACYYAAIADNDVDFTLLLADLAPARQGDQLAGASLPALSVAIEQAAALHAPLWNSPRLDTMDWLQRDTKPIIRALFPGMFDAFRERYTGRLDEECLTLGAGIVDKLDAYLGRVPHARTITHGDMRVDNILFAPDNAACWLVDWQTVAIGSGASDLAYLVGTSLADPAARAAIDRSSFDQWIAALTARGVAPDATALWDDYRVGALSGYFMAVFASMSVERTERGDEMFALMAERPARQAIALASLDVL